MDIKSRNIIIATLLIIVTMIGVFLYVKYNEKSKETTHHTKYEAGIFYKDREHLDYELQNETIVIPTASNQFFKKMKIAVDSQLAVLVFKTKDGVYLGMQFDSLTYTFNDTQQVEASAESLEPFLIKLSDGTEIEEIYFSNRVDKEDQKKIRGLFDGLQVAYRDSSSSWTQEERDANGLCKSHYSVKATQDETKITKKKLEYLSLNSQDAEINIMKSNISAVADKQSWLKTMDILEESLYIARQKPMMTSQLTLHLKRVPSTHANMFLYSFNNVEELKEYLNKKRDNSTQNSNKSSIASQEKIASFFSCMKNKNCNFLNIKKDLMAYLVAHPDDYDLVLDLLKDEKYREYHHRIINMLRDLGTPEAQKALVEVIGSADFTQSNRTQASISIGFLAEPTSQTIESLKSLRAGDELDPQQKAATYYALGNIASSSQEAYNQIAPDIINDLETSHSSSDIIAALGALENSENNEIIPHVTPYLLSVDNTIRRGAVEALRLTPSPKATEALYSQLKQENYDLVINAIAFSLAKKKDLTPDIVKEVAIKATQKIKKSNDTMMVKAVDFLVEQSKTNKDAKDALKTLMTKNLSIEAKKRIIRGL